MQGRLLRAIQALYEGSKACVKVGQSETKMFDVQKGVRQGCTLSPWLFNVFMDKVVKEARRDFVSRVKLSTRSVEVLMFANDMVLMGESVEGLEKNLGMMSKALSRWELKVNWKKTNVMRVARQKGLCKVRIGDQELEQVDEMKYLGVVISADVSMGIMLAFTNFSLVFLLSSFLHSTTSLIPPIILVAFPILA